MINCDIKSKNIFFRSRLLEKKRKVRRYMLGRKYLLVSYYKAIIYLTIWYNEHFLNIFAQPHNQIAHLRENVYRITFL